MLSKIKGTGNSAAPVVNITFPYLDKAHIKAKAGGVEVPITWTSASQVTFSDPVAADVPWEVYRETPRDDPLVNFVDGSVLTEEDLDVAFTQHLYIEQELLDRIDEVDPATALAAVVADIEALNVGKSDTGHGHTIADVVGLNDALGTKLTAASLVAGLNVVIVDNGNGTVTIASTGGGGEGGGATLGDGDYGDVLVSGSGTIMTVQAVGGAVPSFPGHGHGIADVSGLTEALANKQVAGSYAPTVHSHDDRYYTDVEVDGLIGTRAPAVAAPTSFNTNRTIVDADNNAYLKGTGAVALVVTLGGAASAGVSAVVVNRSTQNMTISSASGMYKNTATATTTSGTVAPGGSVLVYHEGAGVWSVKGDVT